MKNMSMKGSVIVTVFSGLLAACGGSQHPAPPPASSPPPAASPSPSPAPAGPVATLNGNRIDIPENVQFNEGSDVLHVSADHVLSQVIDVLHAHPEIHHLRIEGHTDSLGAPAHNQQLSTQRAAAVVHYMQQHGITITLDSQGFGATHPLCSENNDACHTRNRRVDFIVVTP